MEIKFHQTMKLKFFCKNLIKNKIWYLQFLMKLFLINSNELALKI